MKRSNYREMLEELYLYNSMPYLTDNEEILRLQLVESLYCECKMLGVPIIREARELDTERIKALDRRVSVLQRTREYNRND